MTRTERYDGKPHLVRTGDIQTTRRVTRENEAACTVCRARVTVNQSTGEEYGHDYRCYHRPDDYPHPGQTPQVDHSDHVCPTCGRGDFRSESGMRSHHKQKHGESLDLERTCGHCEETFEREPSTDPTYCSRECSNEAKKNRIELTCETCSETFERRASKVRAEATRYCSRACAHEGSKRRVQLTCEQCGGSFEKVRYEAKRDPCLYCSRSCARLANPIASQADDETSCESGGIAGD